MDTFIAAAIMAVIVGLAVLYIYRAKKRGRKCIGCPYGEACMKNSQSCSCGNADEKQ